MHGERGELGHIDFDHLEFVERMVGERIGLVAGALDIGIGERLAVHDNDGVGRDVLDIGLQRRRIHRDQHVGLVAGGENFAAREVKLEAAYSGKRALRRSDFSRKVGQCSDIVAGQCRFGRELHPGQLHPIAGVAGKPDNDVIALQMRLVRGPGGIMRLGSLSSRLRWNSHLSPISLWLEPIEN